MSIDEALVMQEETAAYYGGTVTVKGRDLLSSLMQGEVIEFTRIMVGDGALPEGVNPIDMEDLVHPLYEAQSTVPSVEDNTLYMTVEYRNDMNGGLETGFWLREFGVYAKTDRREEVLLYYATLGNSPQPVNAYRDGRVDTRRYPLSIALALDAEVTVSYNPGAFITAGDAYNMLSGLVEDATRDVNPVKVLSLAVPQSGWEGLSGALSVDVPVEGCLASMVPVLTIARESLDTARDCGLSPVAETLQGALRLYAETAPAEEMEANLVLLVPTKNGGGSDPGGTVIPGIGLAFGSDGKLNVQTGTGLVVDEQNRINVDEISIVDDSVATDEENESMIDEVLGSEIDPGGGGGGGSYVLPTATSSRLGGVKIGSGLNVDGDGTISVDTSAMVTDEDIASDTEVEEMMDDNDF